MTQQRIKATDLERQYIKRRIQDANVTEALAKEVFTMFCEGHGIPGATFVGIDDDSVIVTLAAVPEQSPETGKPELVKEA
jgi:hypothetical protein